MMNRTKEQIDNFINKKLVEVIISDAYIKGEYTTTQAYRWKDEKYETEINIVVARKEKNHD